MSSYLTEFEGTRVLVTGHTGFKGSWLALWLRYLGAEVFGLALPPESPSLFEAAGIEDEIPTSYVDIRDLDGLREAFAATDPEVVFHLAAQSLVRRSYAEPVDTYAINVMGTVHVLEAARAQPAIRAVVVVTSDKCYDNRNGHRAHRETDPMGGADPYSSSKGCAELVTAAYRQSYFSGRNSALVASARAGNVFGGGDWAEDRIVPDIIRALAAGQPAVLRNPHSVRPWQHVLEPLRGYLMLGAGLLQGKGGFAGGWNFGPGMDAERSVQDLAEQLIAVWGEGTFVSGQESDPPPEATLLKLETSKAREVIGYEPMLDFARAIEYTADWYRTYLDDANLARAVTVEQIATYTNLVRLAT